MALPAILFIGLFFVIILIVITGNRLVGYIKAKYPNVYSENLEQNGFIVDTISPNLFLISEDAKKLSRLDAHFKKLRRIYGAAWLLLPGWLIFSAVFVMLFGRYF